MVSDGNDVATCFSVANKKCPVHQFEFRDENNLHVLLTPRIDVSMENPYSP
jgi:hypothetical protein